MAAGRYDRRMRRWNLFTFWMYVVFGGLAAIAAVAGVVLLFVAPGGGVVAIITAAVLFVMSISIKRSYDSVTRDRQTSEPST